MSKISLNRQGAESLSQAIAELLETGSVHRIDIQGVELLGIGNHGAVNVTGKKSDGTGELVPNVIILGDGAQVRIDRRRGT